MISCFKNVIVLSLERYACTPLQNKIVCLMNSTLFRLSFKECGFSNSEIFLSTTIKDIVVLIVSFMAVVFDDNHSQVSLGLHHEVSWQKTRKTLQYI